MDRCVLPKEGVLIAMDVYKSESIRPPTASVELQPVHPQLKPAGSNRRSGNDAQDGVDRVYLLKFNCNWGKKKKKKS